MLDRGGVEGSRSSAGAVQTPPSSDTGAQLGFALLCYMIVVTLIVTLLPFDFAWPRRWEVLISGKLMDVAANVLLFVPLGFLYCFAWPHACRRSALPVLAIGALVSAAIETAQLFEVTRQTSLLDIGANAIGAWLGALAFQRTASSARARGRIIGWLALELPLMGAVYLLVPLLWINSLASQGEFARGVMTLLIGVFGAILLGGLQRHYFAPARMAEPRQTAAFAALWFVAGAFPALAWRPFSVISAAVAIAAVCWWHGRERVLPRAPNRRFEVPLLKTAAPVYAGYLALTLLGPVAAGVHAWRFAVGFSDSASDQLEILRLLELVAAFTLVGYLVAEFHGRTFIRFREAFSRVAVWGISLAILGELLRGYDHEHGASLARGAILAAAAVYGGGLYYLQRAHIVRVLSLESGNPSADARPRDTAASPGVPSA